MNRKDAIKVLSGLVPELDGEKREAVKFAIGEISWKKMELAPKDKNILAEGVREAGGRVHVAIVRWSSMVGFWTQNAIPFYPTRWMEIPLCSGDEE